MMPKKTNPNIVLFEWKVSNSRKNNIPIDPIQIGSFINPVVQKNIEG
jgi:hypothetical protein